MSYNSSIFDPSIAAVVEHCHTTNPTVTNISRISNDLPFLMFQFYGGRLCCERWPARTATEPCAPGPSPAAAAATANIANGTNDRTKTMMRTLRPYTNIVTQHI